MLPLDRNESNHTLHGFCVADVAQIEITVALSETRERDATRILNPISLFPF